MLKSVNQMKELTILASDGEIGKVEEFYFDDENWTIRYLIVNAGGWLTGRRVLISPYSIRQLDWDAKRLHIALTRKQIETSPDIDTDKPVSRQHEAEYMDAFRYPYYWNGPFLWGAGPFPMSLDPTVAALSADPIVTQAAAQTDSTDSHLRSTEALRGYNIEATDGEIGHVEDFIVDPESWSIRYLDLSTRNWLPGKKVLIAPDWIEAIDWLEQKVVVGVSKEVIKTAPEYVEDSVIERDFEDRLHAHYGRSPYWLRDAGRIGAHGTS